MKASILCVFASFFIFHLGTTVAYIHSSPLPRLVAPTSLVTAVPSIADTSSSSSSQEDLQMVFERVFRRGRKKGVQTLEVPPSTKEEVKKPKKKRWRVMFHNSEYMPDRVARVLASVFPTLDRAAAFELCTYARSVGKVAVIITSKKQAEMYCLALQKKGLTATIEPHEEER